MMNSLLKRQIRKYLPKDLQENKDLEAFLDAVNRSYNTSDDQFSMLQRATAISSEELYEASEKLKNEMDSQKEVIQKLKKIINTLKFSELEDNEFLENPTSLSLVDFIDNQAKEIIKINKQKDKLLRDLEQQNRELSDYTHMISHDLVSPLQSIEVLTHWLKDDYGDVIGKEGNEQIDSISDHVEKIDTLVAAIRRYSRISNSDKEFYKLNLNNLVNDILIELKLINTVDIKIPRELPMIQGDKYSLKELFLNLIDNSLKFNDKENKCIEIGFEDRDPFWKFYIKDNGKGIEEKYFEKVFIAFSKLENDYKSAGMGLSIVKKIIDVYEGEIWIESELNIGTTFCFTLKK